MADVIKLSETPAYIIAQAENIRDENTPAQTHLTEASSAQEQILRQQIIEALSSIYDPEIPVNIYELGLIYDIQIDTSNNVDVKMTLTSPGCPVAGTLPPEVERKVAEVSGVNSARVELVWDPPYNMHMMSEAAQLQLGLM